MSDEGRHEREALRRIYKLLVDADGDVSRTRRVRMTEAADEALGEARRAVRECQVVGCVNPSKVTNNTMCEDHGGLLLRPSVSDEGEQP